MRKTFEILSKTTLKELETITNARINRYFGAALKEVWAIEGAPFYDKETQLWNQSIARIDL